MRTSHALFSCLAWIVSYSAFASTPKPLPNQVIRIGNGSEPKDLDPAIITGLTEAHILDNLFEGLTGVDPFTQKVIPGVAESWEVSKDQKTYTFHMRKNAKWSDGKTMEANDFVYSWERVLNPKTASEYAYQLHYIKGAEDYNKGVLKDFTQVGVKALDAHTLSVELHHPTAFFLHLTAFHTLFPTPGHVISKLKDEAQWTRPEHMVSNGPFQLAGWELNKEIKLVKNPNYWDAAKVQLGESYFLPIENVETEEKTFFSGGLDYTASVPTTKIPKYNKEKTANPGVYHPYQVNPVLGTYYYHFNTEKKPTDDARVRKALSLAIDRKAIVERITRGGQLPASFFTPANTGGYTYDGPTPLPQAAPSPEDITLAKKLLAEAGYPEGRGMPTVQILYNTNEAHKKIALAIQDMWEKNLGVQTELFNQEWKVYLDTMKNGAFTVARGGWNGDYADPNTFLDLFVTGGGNNRSRWSNKTYDAYIDEAGMTTDQSKRFELFKKAEALLLEELPMMPIYIYTKTNLISQKIKMLREDGSLTPWVANPSDRIQLKYYVLAE
jgi:oligopeptide transport system substrate-binding protein